jgi:hypothetical protein
MESQTWSLRINYIYTMYLLSLYVKLKCCLNKEAEVPIIHPGYGHFRCQHHNIYMHST